MGTGSRNPGAGFAISGSRPLGLRASRVFGRMNDVDAVELTEGLDLLPMVPEGDHLMKPKDIAAILHAVHLDRDRRAAAAGRRCIDVVVDGAGIDNEFVGVAEPNE